MHEILLCSGKGKVIISEELCIIWIDKMIPKAMLNIYIYIYEFMYIHVHITLMYASMLIVFKTGT